jgi:hypothetical protein
MALLSSMMRVDAFTGRDDAVKSWFDGRQGWQWRAPRRTVAARSPADAAEALRELTELHSRGIVTDTEAEELRARLRI